MWADMFQTSVLILGTLAPAAFVVGLWLLLRRTRSWLRVLAVAVAIAVSHEVGVRLIFYAVDLTVPKPSSLGAGVAAVPMVLLLGIASIVLVFFEIQRLARSKATKMRV